ncbi:hypothetical protein AB205_0169390 [Aquarana catesbeiana]|uniref:NR LBD domain-containing protein n=1 Tax=Aquarana catesbeiana TaxID=8400 RepID=A0A2G9RPA7_AQUCT|nr:hypothetical protein AB205_0169390 [Aquarana catesbeiana]
MAFERPHPRNSRPSSNNKSPTQQQTFPPATMGRPATKYHPNSNRPHLQQQILQQPATVDLSLNRRSFPETVDPLPATIDLPNNNRPPHKNRLPTMTTDPQQPASIVPPAHPSNPCQKIHSVVEVLELRSPAFLLKKSPAYSITKNAVYRCKNGGHCEMDMYMRRKCQECRLKKCKAVGLLTEVQCKSKRLRKNCKQNNSVFRNVKVEDDGCDNRQVTSTTKPAKVRDSSILTDPVDMHHCTIGLLINTLEESANPEEIFYHISEAAVLHVQMLVEFTKKLPGFELLEHDDQIALLKGSTVEATFLRSAQIYNLQVVGGLLQNNDDITDEFITPLFNFFRSMGSLNVTETEYALLFAITVFFSDRPFLKNKICVDKLQEPLLAILHKYSKIYHPEDPQHFARLTGRLTELRTLNHNHSEVLISWKMRDTKLTSLINGGWDLQ